MMKLSEIRDAYEEISGKLSDINRQLCSAGVAIIWIFNKTDNDISVPTELYLPALLLCASLFFDLLQYAISTFVWYGYYLCKREKNNKVENIDVNEPEWLNTISWLIFIIKIISLIIGYILIGKFLISKI